MIVLRPSKLTSGQRRDSEGGADDRRWAVALVCSASALLMFNVTAPGVALPDLARSLGATFADQRWVLASYALVHAGTLLAGGALGDRFGRRALFVAGLGVFACGSLLCATAVSLPWLVAGRVAQGVGAAALFPAGLALIGALDVGADRARAVGTWSASIAAAVAMGPLLGGALVQLAGWRAPFVTAAVLALALTAPSARRLRESRPSAGPTDWAGMSLLSGALLVAVLTVTLAEDSSWTSPPVLLGAAAAAALFGGFVAVERRVAHPLIELRILRNPVFVAATVVALIFAGCFATLTFITLYLLDVAGSDPVRAGLQIAPFAVAALTAAFLSASATARFGTRAMLLSGLGLCGSGLGLLCVSGPLWEPASRLPGLVLLGFGAGFVNATMTVMALATLPASRG